MNLISPAELRLGVLIPRVPSYLNKIQGLGLRASSYLNTRLRGYVTRGYIEPRTHYVGNWSPSE